MPEIHARNTVPRGAGRPVRRFGWGVALIVTATVLLNVAGCKSDDPSSPEQPTTLTSIIGLSAEPEYTAGTTNTINWTVDDAGTMGLPAGLSYLAERAADADFATGVVAGDWVEAGEYTFADLVHDATYYYRVKARNGAGTESDWSAVVSSTQDAVPPSAQVLELDPDQTSLLFNLEITAADVGSGVASVELWFRKNGGELQQYGAVEAGVVSFQTDEGGPHEFIALATDAAGNTQAMPTETQAGTEVPEPIILVDSGGYEWDITNAVLRHNINLPWWEFGLGRFTIRPAIEPFMAGPGDSGWLDADNTADIIALNLEGDARAYKIGDLAGREVADDVVNGQPIAATY